MDYKTFLKNTEPKHRAKLSVARDAQKHVDEAYRAFNENVNSAFIDCFDVLEKASKRDDYTGQFDEVIEYMKKDSKGDVKKMYKAFDKVVSYLRKNIK